MILNKCRHLTFLIYSSDYVYLIHLNLCCTFASDKKNVISRLFLLINFFV